MANTLGTLQGTLILQRALELVFTIRPILKRITLSVTEPSSGSREIKWGQTAYARLMAIPTVNDFGTGDTGVVATDVPVVINAHKEVQHEFTWQEYNSTDRNLVDEAALPMAVAMANSMVDAIAALWTEANFPGPTQESIFSVANSDYDAVIAMRKAMMTRGVPAAQRKFLAVNEDVFATMLADTRLIFSNQNSGTRVLRDAQIDPILGADIFEYPELPSANNLTGFMGTPDSTVLAVRVPSNPEQVFSNNVRFPGNLGYITEPITGMTVMAEQWINADTLAANTRLHWMFGVAKGNGNNGQRLVTASTT